jgi:hypothetical protein
MTIEELELFRGETGVSESIAYLNNARGIVNLTQE